MERGNDYVVTVSLLGRTIVYAPQSAHFAPRIWEMEQNNTARVPPTLVIEERTTLCHLLTDPTALHNPAFPAAKMLDDQHNHRARTWRSISRRGTARQQHQPQGPIRRQMHLPIALGPNIRRVRLHPHTAPDTSTPSCPSLPPPRPFSLPPPAFDRRLRSPEPLSPPASANRLRVTDAWLSAPDLAGAAADPLHLASLPASHPTANGHRASACAAVRRLHQMRCTCEALLVAASPYSASVPICWALVAMHVRFRRLASKTSTEGSFGIAIEDKTYFLSGAPSPAILQCRLRGPPWHTRRSALCPFEAESRPVSRPGAASQRSRALAFPAPAAWRGGACFPGPRAPDGPSCLGVASPVPARRLSYRGLLHYPHQLRGAGALASRDPTRQVERAVSDTYVSTPPVSEVDVRVSASLAAAALLLSSSCLCALPALLAKQATIRNEDPPVQDSTNACIDVGVRGG
ncbi:hypothetical protein C8R44DRAFT_900909 [Mycena epipterygia]|nr:hypothetical protein C8R44DRAFT_900909 [Mycena epipterygia]